MYFIQVVKGFCRPIDIIKEPVQNGKERKLAKKWGEKNRERMQRECEASKSVMRKLEKKVDRES